MSGDCEWTLAMIKPDAVRAGKAEEIKQLILLSGFTIIAEQKIQLTPSRAEDFYLEHYGKSFFTTLVDFMSSGPIWALVLSQPDGIKAWRTVMGPTNTLVAREQAPRSLRALFGTDGTFNATHGSDSTKSAAREIKFYFPNLILEPLLEPSTAQHYITTNLHPALSKALTALAREKPSAEKFEAITFLAQFLLANNPNKPRIITPDAWDPADEEDDDEAEFLNAKMRVDSAEGDVPAVVVPAVQAYQPLTPTTDETANSGRSLSRQSSQQGRSRPGTMSGTSPMGEQKPISAPEDTVVHHIAAPDSEHLDAAATKVQAAFRGHQARTDVDEMRTAEEDGKVLPPGPTDLGSKATPPVDGLPFGAEGFEIPPDSEAALIGEVVAVAEAVEHAVDSGMSAGQAEDMAERVSEQVAQLVSDMVEGGASIQEASAEAIQQVVDEVLEEGGTAAEVEEARAVAVAVAEAMVDGVPGEQTVAVAQEVAVEVAQAAEDANLEEGEAAAAVADAASAMGDAAEAAVLEAGGDAAAAEALAAAVEGEVEQVVADKVAGGESVQEATAEALAQVVDELQGGSPTAADESAPAELPQADPAAAAEEQPAESAAAEPGAGAESAAEEAGEAAKEPEDGAAEEAPASAEETTPAEESAAPEGGGEAEAVAAEKAEPTVTEEEVADAAVADESADPPAEAEPAAADE